MTEPRILYRDEDIVVAVKPYGILSEDGEKEKGMPSLLEETTGGEIFTVHRLDRTTQGVMVYARNKASAAALSSSIADGSLKKTYLAVVEGETDESGELSDLLFFDRSKNKSFVVKRERKGVKSARLSYERTGVRRYGEKTVSLLRINLLTGRTHQIRLQFSSRRHPLVGDRRYGSSVPSENIALCSSELSFPHPNDRGIMSFDYVPDDGAFGVFDLK